MSKRVLFVVSTLTGGGAEKVVSNLTLNFPKDIKIDILVNSVSKSDYEVRGKIISLGMKPKNNKNLLYQGKAFIKRFIKLKKLKKNKRYIACISILDSANIVNVLTGNKNIKTILTAHNTLSKQISIPYKIFVHPLVKLLYNKADKIVCVSKGVEKDLQDSFGINKKKLITIYNGFDVTDFNIVVNREIKNLMTMGRMEQQKGYQHLLRAVALNIKKNPELRLHILGTGTFEPEIKKLAVDLNIYQNIIFHGFVEKPQEILKNADLFVFTSVYEGFGNVLIEAMQFGIPVISSDYRYGAREILAPETDFQKCVKDKFEVASCGILTPVGSGNKLSAHDELEMAEKIFSESIEYMAENFEIRQKLSMAAKKRAQDFSIDRIVQQWTKLIKE